MKAVIFDMDGTLIDSAKAIEVTINEMRKLLGLELNLSSDFIVKTINDPTKNYLKEFYGLSSITKEQKEAFEKSFRKNYDLYARTYKGVEQMLKILKEKGFLIALASNAPKISLEKILEKTKILGYFDYIEGASKDMPQKPDPTMLFKILDEVKNKYSDVKACFVGDSIKDEDAAINAKIPYIQACWGFGGKSDKFENVYEVNDLTDKLLIMF